MAKPKLTYFNAPASRGEECRLALHCAGVDFEDNRLDRAAWVALSPTTPYGQLPIYEIPGKPALAHSNAIMVMIGTEHGLHPTDPYEAARHLGMMEYCEELRIKISATLRMGDAEKKSARETIAAEYLPKWGAIAEKNLTSGPFFAGEKLHVVDIKLYIGVGWITGGKLDHIPTTAFDGFPKLKALQAAVHAHPGVRSWYAKTT